MYPVKKLTWDDELRISDALVAAREVKNRTSDEATQSREDEAILRAGRDAADELVIAHHGLAKRIANQVLFGTSTSAAIDFDDLVQVGMMAMYTVANSFDARRRSDGLEKDTGNRFSVLASLYVRRDMYRAVQREEAILSGSIAASERTRHWFQRKDELEDQIGRKATPSEVSEFSGIPLDSIDINLIGKNPVIGQSLSTGSADEGEDDRVLDVRDDTLTEEIQKALDEDAYSAALDSLMRESLLPGEADALSLWLGLDRGMPRNFSEVAAALGGIRVSDARERVEYAMSRMRHPQNAARVSESATRLLREVESEDLLT